MKKIIIALVVLAGSLGAVAQFEPIPTMRSDGLPLLPPPDYAAPPLSIQEIELPRILKRMDFEPGMPDGGRIAVVVETAFYASVSNHVATYVADLTTHGFDPFVVSFSGSAEQLRSLLQGYYAQTNTLAGALLVGNLPYAIWEMNKQFGSGSPFYEASICDFFLMDLDGVWEDNAIKPPFAAGRYDTRSGDLYCEIWVARIAADNLSIGSNSPADLVNSFFRRNHAYRDGTTTINKAALTYTDNDWADKAETDSRELGSVFPSVTSIAVGEDASAGGSDYRDNYLDGNYELIQVRCHGTATSHQWDDGVHVTSNDYLAKDPHAVAYNIYGCSAADFTTGNCLNRIAVMNPQSGGLVSWSNSGTGGMISFGGYRSSVFYNAIGQGECVGEAFRLWYNSCVAEDQHYTSGGATPEWFNGMRIDGDGCLTLRTPVVRYVSKIGSDTPPYTTEASAARSVNDALDAAGNGDVIKIAAGRYELTEALILSDSKEVTLLGTAPDAGAILDASKMAVRDRCIQVYSGVDAVIENLTLTGGLSIWGGINSPGYGGGARLQGGILRDCVVSNNVSSTGGGLYLANDTYVENCLIAKNLSTGHGGGFIGYGGNVIMVDTVISNNIASEAGGGGITTEGGLYERCLFIDNIATNDGGALYMVNNSTRVVNCRIEGNQCGGNGGGLYAPRGSAVNTLISGNHADGDGGGIYADGYSLPAGLTNLTITGNTSDGLGDGLYLGSDIGVLNCIIHGNGSTNLFWNGETNQTYLSYCCLGEPFVGPGTNNLVADPKFVGGGDYSLVPASACINGGLTVPWMEGEGAGYTEEVFDLAGNARVMGGIVDIGAYESPTIPGIFPIPGTLAFSCYEGYNPAPVDFCVQTQQSNAIPASCTAGAAWLQLSSPLLTGGLVSAGTNLAGTVGCNVAGMVAGTYSGTVDLMTNGANLASQASVVLEVKELQTDQLLFDDIASPQGTGVVFNVVLSALNSEGFIDWGFATNTALSATAPGPPVPVQEQVGSSTATTEYFLHTYYHDSRSQVIYLASELGGAGTITNLAFYMTQLPGQLPLRNCTIRLQHTALSSYTAASFIPSGWQTVYQANLGLTAAQEGTWVELAFDTPFEYDGTNNLLVDFSFNNSDWDDSGIIRCTDMGAARYYQGYSDSNDGDPLDWGASGSPSTRVLNVVPNLRFGLLRPGEISVPISPTNIPPASFVNGIWDGQLSVLEIHSNVVLHATAGQLAASSTPFHVQDSPPNPIPAVWLASFGLPPSEPPAGNPDADPFTTLDEYYADTNPTDSNDWFRITAISNGPPNTVIYFDSSSNRFYTLLCSTNLAEGTWTNVPGMPGRMGTGGVDSMEATNSLPIRFYKLEVGLP